MTLLNKFFKKKQITCDSYYDNEILLDITFKDTRNEYIQFLIKELQNEKNWTSITNYRNNDNYMSSHVEHSSLKISIANDSTCTYAPITFHFTIEEYQVIKPLVNKIVLRDMKFIVDKLKHSNLSE